MIVFLRERSIEGVENMGTCHGVAGASVSREVVVCRVETKSRPTICVSRTPLDFGYFRLQVVEAHSCSLCIETACPLVRKKQNTGAAFVCRCSSQFQSGSNFLASE